MRATIIGYVPSLVVYGSFEPLLGKTYLLHSGAHISSPWFACILAIDFLRSVIFCASWPLGSRLLEYIYALLSLGPFIFGMSGILSPVLVLLWTLVLDLGESQPLTLAIDLKWPHSSLYSICGGC